MMCWSPEQVKACRTRDLIAEYEGKHLPWCVFKTPYLESNCNCHNIKRNSYLEHYAQYIIDQQDWAAEKNRIAIKEKDYVI